MRTRAIQGQKILVSEILSHRCRPFWFTPDVIFRLFALLVGRLVG